MKRNFTYDDELYHYGVKGMKWHKRKARKNNGKGKGDEWSDPSGFTRYTDPKNMGINYGSRTKTSTSQLSDGATVTTRETSKREKTPLNIDGTRSTGVDRWTYSETHKINGRRLYNLRQATKRRKKTNKTKTEKTKKVE